LVLDVRANDGWNVVDPFDPPTAPGIWKPTPPGFAPMAEPQFYKVRPFTIVSGNHFPVPPPPALDGVEYKRLFDEVYSIGRDNSTTRSEDQTHKGHFWFEPPYDSWTRIARLLAADKRYDLHQTARLFALVNMVSCDGLIAGWYWKRHYAFWRPITAIHEADIDNNPLTQPDASWSPLRTTAFHPDHPSTHSVLGGAAAEAIRRFTGSDRHKFCMTTLTAIPAASTRCFESLSQAQEENSNSRVYIGLHFRSAIEAGDRLGRRIGRFAFEHTLRPLASRGRGQDDLPAEVN
jgi:PAP2 superfamily